MPGRPAAFSIKGFIEGNGDKSSFRHGLGINAGALFLDAAIGRADDKSWIFSGFIYSLYEGVPLIIGAIILNIFILIILITKSIEPRVDVLALEEELKSNHNIQLEDK